MTVTDEMVSAALGAYESAWRKRGYGVHFSDARIGAMSDAIEAALSLLPSSICGPSCACASEDVYGP